MLSKSLFAKMRDVVVNLRGVKEGAKENLYVNVDVEFSPFNVNI